MRDLGEYKNIINSKDYKEDKTKFAIFNQNLSLNGITIFSDNENYIFLYYNDSIPAWIWTKNDISDDVVSKIRDIIDDYVVKNTRKFMCKDSLFRKLNYNRLERKMLVGSYRCKNLVRPIGCDGRIELAKMDDYVTIGNLWLMDNWETEDSSQMTLDIALDDAKNMIQSDRLYVWKNDNGEIVSMLYYSLIGDDMVKLSHMYTKEEYRGYGYAKNLVYEVTKMLLDKNLIPVLYTDYDYDPSNKTYKSVGYEDTGVLVNFTISKEDYR